MADLEKTIKGLEHCGNGIKCETCPYHDENDPDEYSTSCNDLLCRDALELLKEKQPKKGKWIRHGNPPEYVIECSVCGQKYFNHAMQSLANYCSMCGAKMESWMVENQTEAT